MLFSFNPFHIYFIKLKPNNRSCIFVINLVSDGHKVLEIKLIETAFHFLRLSNLEIAGALSGLKLKTNPLRLIMP